MCEQHSSVPSQVISSDIMKATVNEIKECEQEKLTTLYKMMSSLKPIEVIKNVLTIFVVKLWKKM